jgi:nucleotide-binding universal stress UspA family protein
MTRHETYPGILVAVDGSPSSLSALRWAAGEAALRHAELAIVHIRTTLPSGPTSLAWPAAPIPQAFFDWPSATHSKPSTTTPYVQTSHWLPGKYSPGRRCRP